MPFDDWPAWPRNNEKLLARYVSPEAARAAIPDHFLRFEPAATGYRSIHDLRTQGQLRDVVQFLYVKLGQLRVDYELEPLRLDDPMNATQDIRPLDEVVKGGRGTCLDLAVLFASLCLEARLLPMVVLLRGVGEGCDHALVLVDLSFTAEKWGEPRGLRDAYRTEGVIRGNEGKAFVLEQLQNEQYLAVECTGFASTLLGERPTEQLSFQSACTAGLERIRSMRHMVALDIAILHAKGESPYKPRASTTVDLDYTKLLGRTFLVDRVPQDHDLIKALEDWHADAYKRVIIVVAAAPDEHKYELLLERYAKSSFSVGFPPEPILLGPPASVDFPFGRVDSVEHQRNHLIHAVANAVGAERKTDVAIRDAINGRRMPCAFASLIYGIHYDSGHKKLLESWLKFWSDVHGGRLRHPVCLFLFIRPPAPPATALLRAIYRIPFIQHLRNTEADSIRREVESMANQLFYVAVKPFEAFENITRNMVWDWLGNEKLVRYCPELRDRRLAVKDRIVSKLPEAFPLKDLCDAISELAPAASGMRSA